MTAKDKGRKYVAKESRSVSRTDATRELGCYGRKTPAVDIEYTDEIWKDDFRPFGTLNPCSSG
jgi:hypothetical protein